MNADVQAAIADALGAEIATSKPVSGGDINDAFELTLRDGRQIFAKTHASAPPFMFEAEAKGLRWLAETNTLPVAEVLAHSTAESSHGFLALSWINKVSPTRHTDPLETDKRLGRGLAELHRANADSFGLDHNNFIGRLPQNNAPTETWSEFYVLRRLEPMLKLAVDARMASSSIKSGMNKLFSKMEDRIGDPEPPARLHGDLWAGNTMTNERGAPVLIDPAVYGGNREIDLAMMKLFGGFSDAVFGEYQNAFALADGWQDRVPLYQLYPLMVHVNLFGGHYGDQVESALRKVI